MKGLGHCVLEHFQSRIKRVCNGCQLNTLGGFLSIKDGFQMASSQDGDIGRQGSPLRTPTSKLHLK